MVSISDFSGSTIFNALGLGSLKEMKQHFIEFIIGDDVPVTDAEAVKRMNHGSANEKNALATLLVKVLPLVNPKIVFKDVGSYVLKRCGKVFLVSHKYFHIYPLNMTHTK